MASARLAALQRKGQEERWLLQPSEMELGQVIGTGGTAQILQGKLRGKEVAVKCLLQSHMKADPGAVDSFLQEVELLSRLRHPNILRLEGAVLDPPKHCWLVTEMLRHGTLAEFLYGEKGRHYHRKIKLRPFVTRLQIALEIALGMQYMHEQTPTVIHRDLKPSNIFVGADERVCIADFGFARTVPSPDAVLTGETGTYLYMAPEVMRREHYDEKCDIFGFGILLNELMTGDHPYIETYFTPVQIAQCVAENSIRPALPKAHHGVSKQLEDLIKACWAHKPSDRPTAGQVTAALSAILVEAKRAAEVEKEGGQTPKGGIEGFFSNLRHHH